MSRIAYRGLGVLGLCAVAVLTVGCAASGPPTNVASVAGEQIPKSAFDHWLESHRGSAKEGSPMDARIRTMTFLVNAAWVREEARRRGLSVSNVEVESSLAAQRKEFGGDKGFDELREHLGLSPADFRARVRLDLLGRKLQEAMVDSPPVAADQVVSFYSHHLHRFVKPASRELRAIVAKRKEQAVKTKSALGQGQSWGSVLSRYAVPQARANGGRLIIDTTNVFGDLRQAVFSASKGEVVGPVPIRGGWWVFEVMKSRPSHQESLSDARATIRNFLETSHENKEFRQFVSLLRRRYRDRTICFSGYDAPECGEVVTSSDAL
jgi:foldase protein PrsA